MTGRDRNVLAHVRPTKPRVAALVALVVVWPISALAQVNRPPTPPVDMSREDVQRYLHKLPGVDGPYRPHPYSIMPAAGPLDERTRVAQNDAAGPTAVPLGPRVDDRHVGKVGCVG